MWMKPPLLYLQTSFEILFSFSHTQHEIKKTGFHNQVLKLNVCRHKADNKQAKNINDLCYNLLNYNTAGNTEGRTHKQTFQ